MVSKWSRHERMSRRIFVSFLFYFILFLFLDLILIFCNGIADVVNNLILNCDNCCYVVVISLSLSLVKFKLKDLLNKEFVFDLIKSEDINK